jgi:hypothetical protein
MIRFLRLTAVFLALALWLGGCFQDVLQCYYRSGIVADDYRYGDLYRLSNLPQFRDPVRPCPASAPAGPDTARTDLYLVGDSFTEPARLAPTDLPVARLTRTTWASPVPVQLNPARRNVLLLETVERHLREHLREPINQVQVVADSNRARPAPASGWARLWKLYQQTRNPESRLEVVLFGHEPFLRVREWKAEFTQRAFGRVDPKVRLSPGGRHLFYYLDADPAGITSAFVPVSDAEIRAMTDSLNQVRDRYRAQGFSEVYLSVIPNKTTILAPTSGRYNHLIERLEGHPARRVPVVSVYDRYRQAPAPVYAPGDSHWNCAGRAIWLERVRAALER